MYINLKNLFMIVLPSLGFATLTNRKSKHRMGDLRFGGASERRRQREGEEPAQCRGSSVQHYQDYGPVQSAARPAALVDVLGEARRVCAVGEESIQPGARGQALQTCLWVSPRQA